MSLGITHYTATSAVGRGRGALLQALLDERSGLRPQDFDGCALQTWTGSVDGLDLLLNGALAVWDCRNARLIETALQQDGFSQAVDALKQRHAPQRIGVFIGTSTAGIHETERAYRLRDRERQRLPDGFDHRHTQSAYSPAEYVQQRFGLRGVCLAISTACSSSAKVFASASRAISAGLCDAAIVGGADSLCLTTLYGFNSLQLVSRDPCRPADRRRNGISIGEAAGFAILEGTADSGAPALLGYGESSDAYHMSSPDPEGRGAMVAMRAACTRAGLEPKQVDYINLHGTATPANDAAEDRAVSEVFGTAVPCSSTKGWTGHTLGAAGIVEAVIALLCVEHGLLPRSLNTAQPDPALRSAILLESRRAEPHRVLSNSFGFGGSNCSLLLGRAA